MLSEDTDEALQTAINGTVDHDRSLETRLRRIRGAWHTGINVRGIGGHVLELESLWQLEVELDGGALMLPPKCVGDGDVDLRTVEGAVARVELPAV